MYIVKLRKEAEIDIADACEWYEKQQKGLSARFIKEFDFYIQSIERYPKHFAVRFSEKFRFANLEIFPYYIVFDIDEEAKTVYINSVSHTSRNPSKF